MATRPPERPEAPPASRVSSVSSQLSDGPTPSPPARGSTSSWSEEPAPPSMDISTGHMVLVSRGPHGLELAVAVARGPDRSRRAAGPQGGTRTPGPRALGPRVGVTVWPPPPPLLPCQPHARRPAGMHVITTYRVHMLNPRRLKVPGPPTAVSSG